MLKIIDNSNYCDFAENIYDARKCLNSRMDKKEDLKAALHDFLWELRQETTILDIDGDLKKAIELLENLDFLKESEKVVLLSCGVVWSPTTNLRYYKNVLQQMWTSDKYEQEWRNIPVVL